MKLVIWKWEIPIQSSYTLRLPEGAKILSVQLQRESCCLWALCSPGAEMVSREIAIYGTGMAVNIPTGRCPVHISTFQTPGGAIVFHAFELL
jgi:hypothetical protein